VFVDVNENFRRFVNFLSRTANLSGTDNDLFLFGSPKRWWRAFQLKADFAAFSTIDVPESDWITQNSEKK